MEMLPPFLQAGEVSSHMTKNCLGAAAVDATSQILACACYIANSLAYESKRNQVSQMLYDIFIYFLCGAVGCVGLQRKSWGFELQMLHASWSKGCKSKLDPYLQWLVPTLAEFG